MLKQAEHMFFRTQMFIEPNAIRIFSIQECIKSDVLKLIHFYENHQTKIYKETYFQVT